MSLQDSGNRKEFESGATRDCREGVGRCDLLPLGILSGYFTEGGHPGLIFGFIENYIRTGEVIWLFRTLDNFNERHYKNNKTMILEVAKHYEEGAKKYSERNWEKGIPLHCFIDSGVRHYLKWLRGDDDEPLTTELSYGTC
jgi:hypothetical protein